MNLEQFPGHDGLTLDRQSKLNITQHVDLHTKRHPGQTESHSNTNYFSLQIPNLMFTD